MKKVKVVLVDDEYLARERIKKMLAEDDEVQLVAEFERGDEAVKFIQSHSVDILYLDIHMPEVDGFEVLNKLDENCRPFVIFATADNASALKAFEYCALDYLLKPFRKVRFMQSLENAKKHVERESKARLSDQVAGLVQSFKKEKKPQLHDESALLEDLLYVQADGNYLRLYSSKSNYQLIRKTMSEFESELEESEFIRIHRSLLINWYFVEELHYLGNSEYEFRMKDDIMLKSGRSYKKTIDQLKKGAL